MVKEEARKKVMDMIANRKRFNRSARKTEAKRLGVDRIVAQFISEFEKTTKGDAKMNAALFDYQLDSLGRKLNSRITALDPNAQVEVIWNKTNEEDGWQDLSVTGVHIKWSEIYQVTNSCSSEEYIDVAMLALEGFFDEI